MTEPTVNPPKQLDIIIPKNFSLRIGGIKWNVSFEEDLNMEGTPLCGLSDGDRNLIKIRKNMLKTTTRITFWHEWTHSILCAVDIGTEVTHNEHSAELVARGMIEMTDQKKKLPAWIFEG